MTDWQARAHKRDLARLGFRRESRLSGALAGRDLDRYDVLIDLVDVIDDDGYVDSTERVTRTVMRPIAKGQRITVGPDGHLYPGEAP